MNNEHVRLTDELKRVQVAIADLVRHQCKHGRQSKDLPENTLACGQFLSELDHDQRGLHGTAAAIRVLREQRDAESRSILSALVAYVEDRNNVESIANSRNVLPDVADKIEIDRQNVIKISELLWAIADIPVDVCNKETLVRDYADLLTNARINDESWGFFVDDNEPSIISTAYATLGLSRIGADTTKSRTYLLSNLERIVCTGPAACDQRRR